MGAILLMTDLLCALTVSISPVPSFGFLIYTVEVGVEYIFARQEVSTTHRLCQLSFNARGFSPPACPGLELECVQHTSHVFIVNFYQTLRDGLQLSFMQFKLSLVLTLSASRVFFTVRIFEFLHFFSSL